MLEVDLVEWILAMEIECEKKLRSREKRHKTR